MRRTWLVVLVLLCVPVAARAQTLVELTTAQWNTLIATRDAAQSSATYLNTIQSLISQPTGMASDLDIASANTSRIWEEMHAFYMGLNYIPPGGNQSYWTQNKTWGVYADKWQQQDTWWRSIWTPEGQMSIRTMLENIYLHTQDQSTLLYNIDQSTAGLLESVPTTQLLLTNIRTNTAATNTSVNTQGSAANAKLSQILEALTSGGSETELLEAIRDNTGYVYTTLQSFYAAFGNFSEGFDTFVANWNTERNQWQSWRAAWYLQDEWLRNTLDSGDAPTPVTQPRDNPPPLDGSQAQNWASEAFATTRGSFDPLLVPQAKGYEPPILSFTVPVNSWAAAFGGPALSNWHFTIDFEPYRDWIDIIRGACIAIATIPAMFMVWGELRRSG